MNSIEMTTIMKKHTATKNHYLGTFSLDNLPKKVEYPSCLIFNNQKSDQPGQHWIAIYFDKRENSEFFDSYGNGPDYYGIKDYLEKNSKRIVWNKKCIQSIDSVYCGFYCILYLISKCKGRSLKYFLGLFE